MKRYGQAVLIFTIVVTMIVLTGCTTFDNFKEAFLEKKGKQAETIRIGILEPQTGSDSKNGGLEIRGIELAHEMQPEVLGKKIELIYADTQSSIYTAETAVLDLIDKKPAIVLGSYGEAVSLTAGQKLEAVKIPAIAITATNPLITANNQYYFRVAFSDASQGAALAQYTVKNLKQNAAAVVRIRDDDTTTEMIRQYSKGVRQLSEDDNAIKATVDLDMDQKDYSESVEEIKASGAKTVLMAIPLSTAEQFFEAADRIGLNDITFLGTKEWHSEDLLRIQAKFSPINIAVAADFTGTMKEGIDQTDRFTEFLKAYEKKYGKEEPEEATALAFDAYMMAVQAIEKANSIDGVKIKEALKSTTDFDGASGRISFNESGEPKKTVNIDVIKEGKFISVYTVR